jgi:hypothetical protein
MKDYVAALSNYTPTDVERGFDVLTDADLQLKSVPLEPLQIMQNMLVYLMRDDVLVPV